MSEWKESKLQEVTIFIKDGTHGTHKDFPDGIPLLSAKDIENGKILIPDNCRTVSEDDYKLLHANYVIENDDLLLTVVGTIGRVAIAKRLSKKITFQRSVSIIRIDKNKVLPDYCFHYFQSYKFQQTLERSKNASAQGGVYLGELAKARIFHPIIQSEQQRIAHILSNYDSVIDQTQSVITKYKDIKHGMLHDLFTRGLDANAKLRPSYQDAPELYKASELGMIPKEWEVKRLEEISTMKSGDGITSEFIAESGEFPVYGGNGLRGYTTTFTHQGDYVLIGRQGALCGNITRVSNKFFASEHAVVVKVNIDIDVDWLSQKLDEMNLNQYSEASAQPGLAVAKILRLFITKPQYNEQKEIGKRLIALDNKVNAENILLHKYQAIKRGLMGDLLSGRISTKHD